MKIPASDDFEELVAEINSRDWLVSDLYQTHWTNWNCALRRNGDFSSAYGRGDSPVSALKKAMGNMAPPTDWKKVQRETSKQLPKAKVKRVRL
jgi:hypothetical protein